MEKTEGKPLLYAPDAANFKEYQTTKQQLTSNKQAIRTLICTIQTGKLGYKIGIHTIFIPCLFVNPESQKKSSAPR